MKGFTVRCTACRTKIDLKISPEIPRRMYEEGYRTSSRDVLFCPNCSDKKRPGNNWENMINWWNGVVHSKAEKTKDHRRITAMMKDPETGKYIEY